MTAAELVAARVWLVNGLGYDPAEVLWFTDRAIESAVVLHYPGGKDALRDRVENRQA